MQRAKRIVVDLTPMLPGGENGGAKIFIIELIGALAHLMPSTDFILLTRHSVHGELAPLDRANVTRQIIFDDQRMAAPASQPGQWVLTPANSAGTISKRLRRTIGRLLPLSARRLLLSGWQSFRSRREVAEVMRLRPQLVFCPFTGSPFSDLPVPTVVVVYDMLHKAYPEFLKAAEARARERIFRNLCKKSALVTISQFTRSKVIEDGGVESDKIFAIPIRTAARLREVDDEQRAQVLRDLKLQARRYFLYPANFWPHKNHRMLLTAFAMARKGGLSPDIKLVCTGAPGVEASATAADAVGLGLGDAVLFPGFLNDMEFAAILRSARGVIFPSLYEGFGMPIVEAMAAGCPVASSKEGSLPEVGGDAVLFFDARKPTEIAAALLNLASNDQLCADLIKRGLVRARAFAEVERMAREYIQVFHFACPSLAPSSELSEDGGDSSVLSSDAAARANPPNEVAGASLAPKVSIITPSFNQAPFIERTIKSVLSQDWTPLEYVVFDGGSTDGTLQILEKYADRVRWVSRRDGGQADAVNQGIRATDGPIIGWLNSDDIYYPGAVRAVVQYFSEHPEVEVVYGMADHIDKEDHAFEAYPTEHWNFPHLSDTCFLCQPAVFFRRSVIERYGLLDAKLRYCMDYEFWLRLGAAGVRFGYLQRKLAGSRLYADNKTLGSRVAVHAEINSMFKERFGQVPYRWLFNYAHVRAEKHTNRDENPNRFLFELGMYAILAELRWNRRISREPLKIIYGWCSRRLSA